MTIRLEPPGPLTVLAARHLDATEGPVQVGRTLTTEDRSAITTVLRYVAMAYNTPSSRSFSAPATACGVCGHFNHDDLQAPCGVYAEGHPGCRCVARHSVTYHLGTLT